MTNFKINGFTDERTCCDRCGKTGLKGTWNIDTTDGNNYFLGSSCIKKAYQMTQKEFTAKVSKDEQERKSKAIEELRKTNEWMAYNEYKESGVHYRDLGKDFSWLKETYLNAFYLVRNNLSKKYNVKPTSLF